MSRLILKPGKESSLLRRHPWVYAGAVARVEGRPGCGTTVAVHVRNGHKTGFYIGDRRQPLPEDRRRRSDRLGVEAWMVTRLGASADHPLMMTVPESEYLKGLHWVRVA